MNKKLVNRVLSLALSMALALTSFVPAHAEEGLADLADDSAVEASLETSVVEETTEADTEEVTADDEQKDEGEEVAAEPETSDDKETSEEAGEASGVTDEEEELVSDGPDETVCTIYFNLNGGEFDAADVRYHLQDGDYATYGISDDPKLVLKAAKKDGATFKGWYTTEDFSDNDFVYNDQEGTYTWEFGLANVTGSAHVYAKFEDLSHATFNFYLTGVDGDDPICSVDVEGKLNSETGKYDFTVPSKDGKGNDIVVTAEDYYIFNGWYSSKDADIHAPEDVEYITLGETVLSAEEAEPEAFNIYGQWQDKAVVVKVDVPANAGEFKVIAGIGNGQTVPVYHLGDTLTIGTTEYGSTPFDAGAYVFLKQAMTLKGIYFDKDFNNAVPNTSTEDDVYAFELKAENVEVGDKDLTLNLFAETEGAKVALIKTTEKPKYTATKLSTTATGDGNIPLKDKNGKALFADPAAVYGYEFVGWYVDDAKEYGKRIYIAGPAAEKGDDGNPVPVSVSNAEISYGNAGEGIYVHQAWTPCKYTINFHLNKGEGDQVLTAEYDENTAHHTSINISGGYGAFSKNDAFLAASEDALFSGWALTAAGNVQFDKFQTAEAIRKYFFDKKHDPKQPIDVYAKWTGQKAFKVYIEAFDYDEADNGSTRWFQDQEIYYTDFADSDYDVYDYEDLFQGTEAYPNTPIILNGTEFVRRGYKLLGWTYKKIVGEGENAKVTTTELKPSATVIEKTAPTRAVFTAKWSAPINYTVKLDPAGGKFTETDIKTSFTYNAKTHRESVSLPDAEVIKKDGYTFAGWVMGGTTYDHYAGDVYQNLTLKASWKANEYKINLDADGGLVKLKGGFISSFLQIDAKYGTGISLKGMKYEKDGYTFVNWKNEKTGKTYKGDETLKNLIVPGESGNDEVTLTAQWKGKSYKVTYKLDGGSLPKKNKKAQKNPAKYTAGKDTELIAPVKTGFVFREWKLESKGTGRAVGTENGISGNSYGNIIATAVYSPISYQLSLNANVKAEELAKADEAAITTTRFAYTDDVDFSRWAEFVEGLLTSEAQAQKTIIGFNTKADGKGTKYTLDKVYSKLYTKDVADATEENPYKPLTLYAQYSTGKVYHVYYQSLAGGTLSKPVVTYDPSKDTTITSPVRTGYKFTGWTVTNAEDTVTYVNKGVVAEEYKSRFSVDDKFALTIKKSEDNTESIALTANFAPVEYTVKVVDTTGAEDELTKGVKLAYDGSLGKEVYFLNTKEKAGLAFKGLYTKKNGKGTKINGGGAQGSEFYLDGFGWAYPVEAFAGLTTKDNATVTLYTYYSAKACTVTYKTNAYVDWNSENGIGRVSTDAKAIKEGTSVFGKGLTLPKTSAKGYTFLGWKISKGNGNGFYENYAAAKADHPGLKVTESKGYVTKINKDNVENVELIPFFSENTYYMKVNTQGGTWSGKKGTVVLDTVKYRDHAWSNMATASWAKKKGYVYAGLSLDKKGKKVVMDQYGSLIGAVNPNMLTSKNKGSFTVYIIWKKVATPAKVNSFTASFYTGNDKEVMYNRLLVNVKDAGASEKMYQVQYSDNIKFKGGKTNTAWLSYGLKVKTAAMDTVYVRVRECKYDSAGNKIFGKWSKIVKAVDMPTS